MTKDKDYTCCECGHKLTQYEVSDNIYAGTDPRDYICYSCQTYIDDMDDDDEDQIPYEDTW
jgi:hypothetical protein